MRMLHRACLALSVVAWGAGRAESARACSAPPCPLIELSPVSATLPANVPAFFVSHGSGLEASLEELPATGAAQQLAIQTAAHTSRGTWIVPVAPLEPGKRYRVSAKVPCHDLGDGAVDEALASPLVFAATEAAPLPGSLGATVNIGRGEADIPVEGGAGCYEAVNVSYVDVQPDFAGVDAGFRPALTNYRVIVDGEPFGWQAAAESILGYVGEYGDPYENEPWRRPDTFRLWTMCEEASGSVADRMSLSRGEHEAYIEAEIPGPEGKVIRSRPVRFELGCDESSSCVVSRRGGHAGTLAVWMLAGAALVQRRSRRRAR